MHSAKHHTAEQDLKYTIQLQYEIVHEQ